MDKREATCSCGQLTVEVQGDPIRVAVCHCLACQRRTGSAFGAQARYAREGARISGRSTEFRRENDADREGRTYHFCPECGATVYYFLESLPDVIAVPIGAFADPGFPAPRISIWENRRHAWVGLPEELEHSG
jgi:hypothetical protein